jgi:hypothetical protein
MTHNFDPVESDSPRQLLVAAKEGVFRVLEAGLQSKAEQLASNEGGGAGEVRLGRLADKGKFLATVEPMHGNSFVTYTPGTGTNLWKRHVIDETIVDGHAVACGDLLGIGGDQVVVGWRAMNRPGVKVGLKLYTPLDAAAGRWRTTLVDDNTMACEDLCLADLNGDGKPDIIASGRATKNVKVYFNETP